MSDIGKSLVTELDVIKNRKANPQEGSYTSYLFSKGVDKILKKVGEEATEVIIAAKDNNNTETVAEICDLLFHVEVLMKLIVQGVVVLFGEKYCGRQTLVRYST